MSPTVLLPLLPEQARFLERPLPNPHQWNVAQLFAVPAAVASAAVADAFRTVVERHDGLRVRVRDGGVEVLPADERFAAEVRPTRALAPGDVAEQVAADAAALQTSFRLDEGPLVRCVHYPHPEAPRLLVLAHHFLVDQVGWALLVAELDSALAGAPLRPVPVSYADIVRDLAERARSGEMAADAEAWERLVSAGAVPEQGQPGGSNEMYCSETVVGRLPAEDTARLLDDDRARAGVTMNAVAVVAAMNALVPDDPQARLTVNLIGNGRRVFPGAPDMSRTIGDFTFLYPLTVTLATGADLDTQLRVAQDHLARVPSAGASFGMLSFLRDDGVAQRVRRLPIGDVVVNFVGRQIPSRSRVLVELDEPFGEELSPTSPSDHLHEIDLLSDAGALELRWYASSELFPPPRLTGYVGRAIRALSGFRMTDDVVERLVHM